MPKLTAYPYAFRGTRRTLTLEACVLGEDTPARSKRHWWLLGYRPEDNRVGYISTVDAAPGGGTSTSAPPRPESVKNASNSNDGMPKSEPQTPEPIVNLSNSKCPSNSPQCANSDLFRNAYPRAYRSWSPNSLQLFAALSSTVVAGAHITEDSQLQPSISALNYPPYDKMGNIEFPSPDKGTVSCTLTGKNLDKVAQLRLRNAKDATDTTTADGTVSVTGNSASATVSFPSKDLMALPQPLYNVYAVSSKGVEQKTGQTIHLSLDPIVTDLSPKSINLVKDPTANALTINGYHLGKVDTVVLTDPGKTPPVDIPTPVDSTRKDIQLSVTLDPAKVDLSAFGTTLVTLDVSVLVSKTPYAPNPAVSFQFTGVAKAKTPAPKKPAAPAPPAGAQRPAAGAPHN